MSDPMEIAVLALAERFDATCDAREDATAVLTALHEAGWRIVKASVDDPHYVVFKEGGWEIEHSAACRNAGSMLECQLHEHLNEVCYGPPVEGLGRYRADLHPADGLWNIVPSPDAPATTALLFTEEWTP